MRLLLSIGIATLLLSCGQETPKEDPVKATVPAAKSPSDTAKMQMPGGNLQNNAIEVKTFQNRTTDNANGTWGYDVYMDGKPYIHQPSVPAIAGIKGFRDEISAKKAGELMAFKIKHNIMPPSVTPHELDSMGITY